MNQATETHTSASHARISVVADPELVEALQEHQRDLQARTGLRVSLSQVAGSLMRRGLASDLQQSTK